MGYHTWIPRALSSLGSWSTAASYNQDVAVAWAIRFVLYASCAAFLTALVACGTVDEPGIPTPVKDLSQGSHGSVAGTWNQTPHGGSDEKSNSAPQSPGTGCP